MGRNTIYIDGWPLGMGGVGVGSFATRLISALAERRSELPGDMRVMLPRFFEAGIPREFREKVPVEFIWIPKTIRPLSDQALWQQRLGAYACRTGGMLFCLGPFWSVLAPKRVIVCHHDRIYHYWPQYLARSRFRRWLVNRSESFLPRSSLVITGSRCAREELRGIPGMDKHRIEVIFHWLPDGYDPETARRDAARVRAAYRLPETYWLYIGGYDLRKNLNVLLAAYAALRERNPPPLVLAGKVPPPAPYYCDIAGSLRDLNLKDTDVLRPGLIAAEDMPGLFGGASLLIYPSAHEGYGLPPMEAMGCGCNAICADNTSLPEVVTDASHRFDASTQDDLTRLLRQHLDKPLPFNPSFRRDLFDKHAAVSRYIQVIQEA
jgi:glycosyltransferase involved in cell wall biosynthesis